MSFLDRTDAGRRLAARLGHLRGGDVVVLGIPRGGVLVAAEVAAALGAPLDVVIVRKLGAPGRPELGLGAIGEEGVRVVNHQLLQLTGTSEHELARVEARERTELERRAQRFRGHRSPVKVRGRTAVIVDDGIATGSTTRAACRIVRARGASRVVVAVPVAPPDWTTSFSDEADELIAVETPAGFHAVGQWYQDFHQASDEEVAEVLGLAHRGSATDPALGERGTAEGG